MLSGYCKHQQRMVLEGSAVAPVQTSAVIFPSSNSTVLLRLVLQDAMMQDAMRTAFDVYSEVRIMYTDTLHTSFISCTVRMLNDVYHTTLAPVSACTRHLVPSTMMR